MSKHRRKSNEGRRMDMNQFNTPFNNNPFGISPQQLLGLLGSNIDMNGLGNILSSMGKEGFDLNSVNQQMNSSGMTNNYNSNFNNNLDNEVNNMKDINICNDIDMDVNEDENIKFLKSIRSIANPERIEFIDRIIELYNKGVFNNNK